MGHHLGIGQAVRHAVKSPQLVSNCMHVAHVHHIDRLPGEIGGMRHRRPHVGVATIAVGAGQMFKNQLHGSGRCLHAIPSLPDANIGLYRVGQGVHPGSSGDVRRQTCQ